MVSNKPHGINLLALEEEIEFYLSLRDDPREASDDEIWSATVGAIQMAYTFFKWSAISTETPQIAEYAGTVRLIGAPFYACDPDLEVAEIHDPEIEIETPSREDARTILDRLAHVLGLFSVRYPSLTIATPPLSGESQAKRIAEEVRELLERQKVPRLIEEALTPQQEREYIAIRLGRQPHTLSEWIWQWKQEHGELPPWAIPKGKNSWYPDLEAFERWRRTPEGSKARKIRQRPPKYWTS